MSKAGEYDRVRLTRVAEGAAGRVIPAGTEGVVVDVYTSPREGYAVDVTLNAAYTDEAGLHHNGGYDNVTVGPESTEVVSV